MPPMFARRALLGALAAVLPGLLLLPVWGLAGLGAGEDDVLYYLPSRVLFQQQIRSGELPWFNPWTGLGRPLLADPQSAVFYPTTWLFVALDPLWAYPASLWLHYSLALLGMYALLRAQRLDRTSALLGAVALAFCGFMLAHRAHLSMQHAAAWTPLVFWRLSRYAERGGVRRLGGTALVAAMQAFAGHVQISALTALGTLVYLLAGPARSPAGLLRWALTWVCAAALFAVQALPTCEYLRVCTRMERGYLDFTENSWHPLSAISLVAPMLLGQRTPNFFDQPYSGPSHQCEQFAYIGAVPLLLALLAVRRGWRSHPPRRAWIVLGGFSALTALGLYGPVAPLLYWLPGASLFRCPARALLLVHLATAALAAHTLHDLGLKRSPDRARLRLRLERWTQRPWLVGLLVAAAPAGLMAAAAWLVPLDALAAARAACLPWKPAVYVPLAAWLAALLALRSVGRHWQHPQRRTLLIALTAVDLGVIGWTLDVPAERPASVREMLHPAERQQWSRHVRGGTERVWVVTARGPRLPGEYERPLHKGAANVNLLDGIASLTDYGPFQPRVLQRALEFKPWGEAPRAAELLAEPGWMQWLNVGWVLLCEPIWPTPPGFASVQTTADGYRLLHNPAARGLAFLEDATTPAAIWHVAERPYRQRTHVDYSPAQGATAPARLILSLLALPGWRAFVDGKPADIEAARGLLLSVRLPARSPVEVEWRYFPPGLLEGAAVSLGAAVVLVVAAWRERREPMRTARRSN